MNQGCFLLKLLILKSRALNINGSKEQGEMSLVLPSIMHWRRPVAASTNAAIQANEVDILF